MKEQKWYLILEYHDEWTYEFDDIKELLETLDQWYENSSDFHYKIIKGREYSRELLEDILRGEDNE